MIKFSNYKDISLSTIIILFYEMIIIFRLIFTINYQINYRIEVSVLLLLQFILNSIFLKKRNMYSLFILSRLIEIPINIYMSKNILESVIYNLILIISLFYLIKYENK